MYFWNVFRVILLLYSGKLVALNCYLGQLGTNVILYLVSFLYKDIKSFSNIS